MAERPYSRVYWTIVDDDKFETVFDDDHHLAAWLRLLLIADQAYPASAHLPANVRPASVRALVASGLVTLTGRRYRICGLKAERERRAEPGRIGANARWSQSERSANGMRSHSERNAPGEVAAMPDETRLDKTSSTRAMRETNGRRPVLIDERTWTEEEAKAAYIDRQQRRTGVTS